MEHRQAHRKVEQSLMEPTEKEKPTLSQHGPENMASIFLVKPS